MANPKNTAELAKLKEYFDEADSLVLTEYRGLTVQQITDFRTDLGKDVKYHVAKNTLIKLAAAEAGIRTKGPSGPFFMFAAGPATFSQAKKRGGMTRPHFFP